MRSDQEPSLLAFKDALVLRRKAETSLIESPVLESKSNGLVERAIRSWRDQYRTLKHNLERRLKQPISASSPLTGWLVTWAADVIYKYRVQANGRTAFEMMTQHRCTHLFYLTL